MENESKLVVELFLAVCKATVHVGELVQRQSHKFVALINTCNRVKRITECSLRALCLRARLVAYKDDAEARDREIRHASQCCV